MKETIGIYTLGCRLNTYESDAILNIFQNNGFSVIPFEEGPDVAIINTCTVTNQADAKNRNIVNKILKKNPHSKIIITGCYAQTDKESLKNIPNVLIVGNENKHKIFEIYKEHKENSENRIFSSGPFLYNLQNKKRKTNPNTFDYNVLPVNHTRAYIKIQDGCDRKCSYCKIPLARGGGVSLPLEKILENIKVLQERRIPEIILTGVNIGWYRYNGIRFLQLLEKILDILDDSRLRISSLEPSDVNEELAKLTLHPKFCNFLHIPLQSGSDRILRLMKRSYSVKTFSLRIEKVLKYNPNIFLGTDLIVGFPTEEEKDFESTIKLLESLNFINVHPFPFSLRKGTEIETFVNQNPNSIPKKEVIKNRIQTLLHYKNQKLIEYANKQKEKILEGIIEKIENNFIELLTDNYLNIHIPNPIHQYQRGELIKTQVTEASLIQDKNQNPFVFIQGKIV
ncbi:MAG: tRNA (N(6)-L-threonylcarbamoyladenosine(37)-C(2))-methylthiotransferase MtaB [Leptonema sp. (in: bacteria)]